MTGGMRQSTGPANLRNKLRRLRNLSLITKSHGVRPTWAHSRIPMALRSEVMSPGPATNSVPSSIRMARRPLTATIEAINWPDSVFARLPWLVRAKAMLARRSSARAGVRDGPHTVAKKRQVNHKRSDDALVFWPGFGRLGKMHDTGCRGRGELQNRATKPEILRFHGVGNC